ncbi:MAG TPA: TetR family transcriptional regulator [Pseudonocardiaceae bacterium]|nr:TetR family transcriptional regulator [Pseudonocardiaceae bacterium]
MPPAQRSSDTTGLRERKRAKVRREIQANALRLFREQGYEATTVQEIAEAAVISESTVYRHFSTKADIVMSDDLDPVFVQVFRAQPPESSAVEAIRAAMTTVLGAMSAEDKARQRELLELVLSVPDLRATMLNQLADGIQLLADELGLRTGRPADDPPVRALAGAVVGAATAVMFAVAADKNADLATMADEAIGALGAGLAL